MEGTRVERKGDLKAVAWRRVERTGILEEVWKQVLESGGVSVYFMGSFECGMEASS